MSALGSRGLLETVSNGWNWPLSDRQARGAMRPEADVSTAAFHAPTCENRVEVLEHRHIPASCHSIQLAVLSINGPTSGARRSDPAAWRSGSIATISRGWPSR